jgi:hypothetical protein
VPQLLQRRRQTFRQRNRPEVPAFRRALGVLPQRAPDRDPIITTIDVFPAQRADLAGICSEIIRSNVVQVDANAVFEGDEVVDLNVTIL